MLIVPAREFSYPVLLVILMKTGNALLDALQIIHQNSGLTGLIVQ